MEQQEYQGNPSSAHRVADEVGDKSVGVEIHRITACRIMPLLVVGYLFAQLDRINIGFAKLQMTSDLGFSDTAYGLGAGLFFVTYSLFGMPSNVMLDRLGARRWIALIMISWGMLSAATSLVKTTPQFYVLRLLLGVAEAGFFPGILVYINRWFPPRRRGQMTALFAIALPVAGLVGGPVSGSILEGLYRFGGLRGWQWMFLLEGLPVLLLGSAVYAFLPEHIDGVSWLSERQKDQLKSLFTGKEEITTNTSLRECVKDVKVWQLISIYFAVLFPLNTIGYWMPTLIHGAGIAGDARIGFLSAVPYLAGCVFMIAVGHSSDRLGERRWHLAIPILMSAGGLVVVGAASTTPVCVMIGLVIVGMGASASLPMFWQLAPAFMSATALAVGIAFVSSLGSISSFLVPYFIGWMRDTTHSTSVALYVLAALTTIGGLLVLRVPAAVVNPR